MAECGAPVLNNPKLSPGGQIVPQVGSSHSAKVCEARDCGAEWMDETRE
jgi:hypothetical protein